MIWLATNSVCLCPPLLLFQQMEYEREGISWSSIKYNDNQLCLDLIEVVRPPGILALLDEESRFPKVQSVLQTKGCCALLVT